MRIPGYSQLKRVYRNLSPSEFGIFIVIGIMLTVSVVSLASDTQNRLSATTPAQGGTYTEGVIGFPRYINPVLASTDTDQDLSALIYAGLTKINADGEIEMDLAENMEVSDDGETYTFSIDPEARFHDGHPVQAEDVVYTVNMIQDPRVNSPYQADWNRITAQAEDEQTVVFDLPNPFHGFPYNARIGILPKHQWQNETTESFPFSSLNTNPVGSGPYEVSSVSRNDEGIPTRYSLTAAENSVKTPYIARINVRMMPDAITAQEALADGSVDTLYGINPETAANRSSEGGRILSQPFNRIFAVFFNQNQNEALADQEVRTALSEVIPKEQIIQNVLHGYGSPINSPLPPEEITVTTSGTSSNADTIVEASKRLEAAGWELDEGGNRTKDGEILSISLSTAEIPALQQTAGIIANHWNELGVSVDIAPLPTSDLSRDVIRPREYEALLFGQSLNQNRDLYPFWHSSAQDDPGLNLSMYTNSDIDDILTELRTTTSTDERNDLQETAADLITSEQPATFIYTPAFIYALPEQIENVELPPVSVAADRFAQIEDWYIETTELWGIFSDTADEGEMQVSVSTSSTSTGTTTSQ